MKISGAKRQMSCLRSSGFVLRASTRQDAEASGNRGSEVGNQNTEGEGPEIRRQKSDIREQVLRFTSRFLYLFQKLLDCFQ